MLLPSSVNDTEVIDGTNNKMPEKDPKQAAALNVSVATDKIKKAD